MFRFIPVDAERFGNVYCLIAPVPKTDIETGKIKMNPDGDPLWVVGVALREPGSRTAMSVDVTVAEEPQGIVEGSSVRLVGLVASQWEQNGRAGMVWRADRVLPLQTDAGTSESSSA